MRNLCTECGERLSDDQIQLNQEQGIPEDLYLCEPCDKASDTTIGEFR